jgi:TetR/AcrR family transcriptional regulator
MPQFQGGGAKGPASEKKTSRKEQILQSLARMLEAEPGGRITTAALAREVGVSEAALYRHFPSKTRMFEDLIVWVEDSLFLRIHSILREHNGTAIRLQNTCLAVLDFCQSHPGIARILTGDAITGENERLRSQVTELFERLGTLLKQVLKEGEQREGSKVRLSSGETVNLLLCLLEGRLCQFVRSGFRQSPLEYWDAQWQFLSEQLFMDTRTYSA